MKRFLKNILFYLLSKRPLLQQEASILLYHSIQESDYFSSVPPLLFQKHMRYLVDSGIPVISLKELLRRLLAKEPLNGSVVITFDDGYRDNYASAFPVLKEYNIPATIFVTTKYIGSIDTKGNEYMSAVQLREMEASGLIDIEPHTESHPHLTRLPVSEAEKEILISKTTLETLLHKECTVFAYPYGKYTDVVVQKTKEIGFRGAVTVQEGIISPINDPFRLSRNSIDSTTSFVQFKGKVTSAIRTYEKLKSHLLS